MSTSQNLKVNWKNVPTRTITAGGVEFAYRELGTNIPGLRVLQEYRAYGTRFPFGACPCSRNVLINSNSPHTVMPEKRLYHSPSGTSGSASSHVASNSSCVAGIFRL